MSDSHAPPGWPAGLRQPDAPDWVPAASAWLADVCPPDYRGHAVITRNPVVLARLAVHHTAASLQAQRAAVTTWRTDMAGAVDAGLLAPAAVDDALAAMEVERGRLLAAWRGALVVEQALRGVRRASRL